jgi:competence protein ComEC
LRLIGELTSFYVLFISIIGFAAGNAIILDKPLQALIIVIGFSLIERTSRSGKLSRHAALLAGIFIASVIRSSYDPLNVFHPGILSFLEEFFSPLKAHLIHGMGLGLTETKAKLISGIVLGRGSGIIEISNWPHFVKSGMSHLLVASGAQVSLTVFPVIVLAENLKVSARIKNLLYLVAGILLVILLVLVGQEPSILRAITACWLYLIARLINRKANSLNIIYVTALIWLWIDPGLIKNLGFKLSYSASWGLIYLFPKLRIILPVKRFTSSIPVLRIFHGILGYIHALVLLSLSAQIAVMPVLAYHFHKISISGFIANILALPVSELATYTALLSALIALISEPVTILINSFNSLTLGFLDSIAHFFSRIPAISSGPVYFTGFILPYIFAALYFEARFQPASLVIFMDSAYRFLHPFSQNEIRKILELLRSNARN